MRTDNSRHDSPLGVELFEQTLNDYVERFEAALEKQADVDVSSFLPSRQEVGHEVIAVELLRVDLQRSWDQGAPATIESYRERFPDLLSDAVPLAELAFEEYRMRRMAGHDVAPADYVVYGIDTDSWPKVSDSTVRVRKDSAATVATRPGDKEPEGPGRAETLARLKDDSELFGFKLHCEIGNGAFARVFRAKQTDLAGRTIVLKVTANDKSSSQREADQLARLQHTNIVPIYSVHESDEFTAICMPDFGPCTLRDAIKRIRQQSIIPVTGQIFVDAIHDRRSEIVSQSHARQAMDATAEQGMKPPIGAASFARENYVDSCVRISLQIGAALQHAHEQNIVHCDLKPANVLLAEHGPAMLLDFNLSDTITDELRTRSIVGGTLPYAAPEHLAAILSGNRIGTESDIYSLGVILYELLTGSLPFSTKTDASDETIGEMIAERASSFPAVRSINPNVPKSLSALVGRMLHVDPAKRPNSIRNVCEDLQNHLDHRPLKHVPNISLVERLSKWSTRHPRLSSSAALSAVTLAVACVLGAAVLYQHQKNLASEYDAAIQSVSKQIPFIQAYTSLPNTDISMLERGLELGEQSLSSLTPFLTEESVPRYQPPWLSTTRESERATLTRCLKLMASASERLAKNSLNETEKANFGQAARRYARIARRTDFAVDHANDQLTAAIELLAKHDYEAATTKLEQHRNAHPFDLEAWFLLGNCFRFTGKLHKAEACLTTCAVMWSDVIPAYFYRGLCRLDLENYKAAEADFSKILEIDANHIPALINRSIARREFKDYENACRDLDLAIELNATQTRVFFMRSELRQKLGDIPGAEEDLAEGLARQPSDEQSFVRRGVARMKQFPDQAIDDFKAATKLNPRSYAAHRNWAYVVGELKGNPKAAIAILDQMLEWTPHPADELFSRSVMLGRIGNRKDAIRDVRGAIRLRSDSKALFQAACVYALVANDQDNPKREIDQAKAVTYVRKAIANDRRWLTVARHDPDLKSLHGHREFDALIAR